MKLAQVKRSICWAVLLEQSDIGEFRAVLEATAAAAAIKLVLDFVDDARHFGSVSLFSGGWLGFEKVAMQKTKEERGCQSICPSRFIYYLY